MESSTVYFVTFTGLDPFSQETVKDVMFNVQVETAVVGITARVAVVTFVVHGEEDPLMMEFT